MTPYRTIAVAVLLWLSTILVSACGHRSTQARLAVADLTALDSSHVAVEYADAVTDPQTDQTTLTATVTNISPEALTGPVYLAIDATTSSSVTVVNADMTSVEGIPLFLVEAASWPAGTSRAIPLVFANPTRVRFVVQHRILIRP